MFNINKDTGSAVEEETICIELKNLPSYAQLNTKVQDVVKKSSWMERHGFDWLHLIGAGAAYAFGLICLSSVHWSTFLLGVFLCGCSYSLISHKSAHMSAHGSFGGGTKLNEYLSFFLLDFMSCFSSEAGYDIHIKSHHPHTNIIGMGDSSSFKAPFLSTYIYMFVGPLIIPLLMPIVSLGTLIEMKNPAAMVRYIILASLGTWFNLYMLIKVAGFKSMFTAFLCLWAYRDVFSIPYIHVNIFQHIGLPMYSSKHRPVRLYQMSTGVLNLSRNSVLDYIFGHSLINCHVEHHLFPRLSDHMCLKIKPLVRDYLKEAGLPYHEATYVNRLQHFLMNYEKLMVNAPPITHFVGIQ